MNIYKFEMFNEIMKINYILSIIASILLIFGVALFSLNAYDKSSLDLSPSEASNVKWLDGLIEQEKTNPVVNPPSSITECNYNGEVVYYLPARCCGVYGFLFNNDGEIICSPDGGFTGRGDGRCVDFFSERIDCETIWADNRSFSKEVSIE